MMRVFCLLALGLFLASPTSAQTFRPPDPGARPWSTAQMNIGPIYFAPAFELSNVGVDNNVFNEDKNPKSDLTGTLGMKSLVGLHFGEGLVFQITQANSYIYYRRYRSERSVDSGLNFVLEYRTRIFRPWVRWDKVKTSQRQGDEIDERAQRTTPNFDFGADVNAIFRMGISVAAHRSRLRFKDGEHTADGVDLAQVLNNQSDSYQGLVRYQLTELTDLLGGVDYVRDRFSGEPLRDNDSRYYYAGLRTQSGASFTGSATVGYRHQAHLSPTVPNFNGITAQLDASMTLREGLRLQLSGGRDLAYSYQADYPYFIDEAGGFTLTDRFSDHFDIVLSARERWLNYNDTVTGLKSPHVDKTTVLGIGGGYYVGGTTRLGLLFETSRRQSPIAGRSYHNHQVSTNYKFSF